MVLVAQLILEVVSEVFVVARVKEEDRPLSALCNYLLGGRSVAIWLFVKALASDDQVRLGVLSERDRGSHLVDVLGEIHLEDVLKDVAVVVRESGTEDEHLLVRDSSQAVDLSCVSVKLCTVVFDDLVALVNDDVGGFV